MDPLAHASIGLMAKTIAPRAPLWTLLAATQVLDVVSLGLIAAGIEHGATTQMDFEHGLQYLSQPAIAWSHGLFMSIVWSVAVAVIAFLIRRDRRTGIVLGLMVFSHWVLDFIVYLNIPVLFDGSPITGLGLITSGPGLVAGIVLEIVLIGGGIAVYLVSPRRAAVQAGGRFGKRSSSSSQT
jgi:membrane-bound metal-dependent hydrolase YbcI (DUF457 family)